MWGNPKLVTWDYGKDINVTLEDAVISWEEMRILMGGVMNKATEEKPLKIRKTAEITISSPAEWAVDNLKYAGDNTAMAGLTSYGKHNLPTTAPANFKWVDMTRGLRGTQKNFATNAPQESDFTDANGNAVTFKVRIFWEDTTTTEAKGATEIVISPDRYPGTLNLHVGLLDGIKMSNQFGELLEAAA